MIAPSAVRTLRERRAEIEARQLRLSEEVIAIAAQQEERHLLAAYWRAELADIDRVLRILDAICDAPFIPPVEEASAIAPLAIESKAAA